MSSKKNDTDTILAFLVVFCSVFSCNVLMAMAADQNTSNSIPVNVGVVLDVNTLSGKIWLTCIKMALSDFYDFHRYYNTRLVLNIRDSKQSVVGAAAAALDLIKNEEVQAILGPETSMQASFIVNLGDQSRVPIISFSATSPSLTSLKSSYFFQFTQSDSYQVKAISAIVQNFGWRQVVPIYVDNTYGEGVIPFLVDALLEVDAHVPYRSAILPSATDDQIEKELYKLKTMHTRVFIVHMMPGLSSKLFSKAKKIGMMSQGYVWILTNGVGNSLRSMNSVLNSMQGVLGVETYVPRTSELKGFEMRWERQFKHENPTIIDIELDVFGFQAYDAAFALAMAVEHIGYTIFDFQKGNACLNSTNLETCTVSRYGPKLSDALSVTKFQGLAGDFSLVNGQLQSSAFKIVNVNGDEARAIAFWTPENGMVKTLNSTKTCMFSSTSKCNLEPIIWPGDSVSVPKGWEIPTNNKKLRIGVPVKDDFTEFVKITIDTKTNTMDVTGFSIDVFKAAVEVLPYALAYEFIPFSNSDGTSAGTYNDLVYQVFLGTFDAVVGDTTIIANRSLYVDFTLPYTESGVGMVVPVKDIRSKNAWVFLKPLTWKLWLTTSVFFVFIGFVVWVLEHQKNEDFCGPPLQKVGTSFLLCFSTIFCSHREKVASNLTRFVLVIWVFVVLVLTQSYTAKLSSLLTVQQLQPSVTNIEDLLRKGDNVGYIKNAHVYGLLKQVGFDDSKLKCLRTMEEIDEALSEGSAKGGIAAVVDEFPALKLFVAKYCSKYTIIGPIFKTNGFGFVFPKRSPLLPDVSKAILNVTEGEKIMNIEDKWFKKDGKCQDWTQMVSSDSLGVDCFWGLFLIAGGSSIFALIIFLASFLLEYVFKQPDSKYFKQHQRDGMTGNVGDEIKATLINK